MVFKMCSRRRMEAHRDLLRRQAGGMHQKPVDQEVGARLQAKRSATKWELRHELLDVERRAARERELAVRWVKGDKAGNSRLAVRAAAHELDLEVIWRARWWDEVVVSFSLARREFWHLRDTDKLLELAWWAGFLRPGGGRGDGEGGKNEELHCEFGVVVESLVLEVENWRMRKECGDRKAPRRWQWAAARRLPEGTSPTRKSRVALQPTHPPTCR